jgi:hypothetical protein
MWEIFVKEVVPGAAGCASHATQVLRPEPYESLGKALYTRWAPRGVADGLGSHTFLTSRFNSHSPLPSPSFSGKIR